MVRTRSRHDCHFLSGSALVGKRKSCMEALDVRLLFLAFIEASSFVLDSPLRSLTIAVIPLGYDLPPISLSSIVCPI